MICNVAGESIACWVRPESVILRDRDSLSNRRESGSLFLVHSPNAKPALFHFTLSQHTAMAIQITVTANDITAVYEDTIASVPGNSLCFAHFGCKLLGTLLDDFKKNSWPFPDDLAAAWNKARPGWRNKKDAVARLADALLTATDACGSPWIGSLRHDAEGERLLAAGQPLDQDSRPDSAKSLPGLGRYLRP